ncbi:MAG TPA: caspase family protein, partial [Chitinophagaceae bacterium]|nr:caspase family protein [Chitinophagaceae bacterium]
MKYCPKLLVALLLFATSLTATSQTPLLPRDPSISGPQTFAMVLGVSKYKYVKPLAFADKDAILFKDYLKSPGGGSVKDENIFLLLNEEASNANFWGKGFQWLKAKKLQKGDRLFIYLAGHGDAIDEDQFFFLGFDCDPKGDKNNYLVAGAIQLFNLKKKISNETAKGVEVIFIMDACRSNELPGGSSGQNFLNSAVSEKQAGEIIMLATAAGQESLEDASIGSGQGLFTYYLVDGLNGVADSIGIPDKRVTFREIQAYVNKNVPSIAQLRFKRKQEPYFCCTENSDRVISTVDTAYLQKWLKTKKQGRRGPGNSFDGELEKNYRAAVDTNLVETYNRFNRAIDNKQVSTAEDYFNQLNKKFPGNPYTLDAKSSLAVEYINIAQGKVDRYLDCGFTGSAKEKQENAEAADRLEKAIASVREDDADFANSLLGRLYLLKASSNETISAALRHAGTALGIDRNGAYAMNKLAQLHLENNRADSALYYADKAAKTAPNWPCALTTLALARSAANTTNKPDEIKQPKRIPKSSFGIAVGGGINRSDPTFQQNANVNVIAVDPRTTAIIDLGVIVNIPLGQSISVRPAVTAVLGNTELIYQRRNSTGGQIFRDTILVKNTSVKIALPLVIRFTNKKINPYLALGPAFSYVVGGNSEILPTKKSLVLGDAGFGVEFTVPKTGMVISPELRYSRGLTD